MKLHHPKYPVAKRISLVSKNQPAKKYSTRIAISFADHIRVIETAEISYLKAESNYTHIYLEEEHLIACITLKKFSSQLNTNQFLRVHQSYLVQAKWITEYHMKNNNLTLHNQTKIPVSRSKKHIVTEYLKTFQI